MALYTNELNQNKDTKGTTEKRARNARIITTGAAALVLLLMVGIVTAVTIWGQALDLRSGIVALVGLIVAAVFVRKNKVGLGIGILLVTLQVTAVIVIATEDNIGSAVVITVFFVSLGIILATLAPQQNRRVIPVLIVVDLILIVLDQIWPMYRNPVSEAGTTLITGVAVLVFLVALVTVVRQFNNYSLRGKLVSATIAVALLAVVAVAVGINTVANKTVGEQVGQNLSTLASSHALSIGEFLARKINILETLSFNRTIASGVLEQRNSYTASTRQAVEAQLKTEDETWADKPDDDPLVTAILENDMVSELNQFQIVFPDNIDLLIADQFGAPVAATYRPDSYYQGDEEWWLDAYMNGFGSAYISLPKLDVERDVWTVDMAVPIRGEVAAGRTQITGVLHATFSLQAMADIMEAARFGETGEIEIHFPDSRVLESDDGKLALETNDLQFAVEEMVRQDEVYDSLDHHSVDTLISAAGVSTLAHEPVVDATNWVIVIHQDEAEGLAPVEQQGRFNIVLGLIVIFSAGVVAWIVGTRLTEPITSLTETAVQVSQGNLEARSDVQSEDELGVLAAAFNAMTDQLQGAISNLEQRVAERTQALAISIDVGRRLVAIHDQDELVTEVVNQVRDAFDYYHVHIYLMDEDKQTLVMASGTGEAGKQMIADGHQLPVGTGLVGRAAEANIAILVPDTSLAEDWLPNPLLADTKSETAVPIAMGDDVLGVLDVQHNIVNGLQQADADLLQSIANQVAVALRNARLYQETQQQALNETLLRSINQQILSTTDMETAMKVAIREIGQATDSPGTSIHLKIDRKGNGR